MVFNTTEDGRDQDNVVVNWGCPFNPEFLDRHLTFLREIGKIPNLTEVWINDEAKMGFDENKIACYCPVCKEAWKNEFGTPMPMPPFKDHKERADFLMWRFSRWNDVHKKMKAALNKHHTVHAVFETSPDIFFKTNPWISAVDLSNMIEHIDGISTDPYYTFHLSYGRDLFLPKETYLSESCRYLHGVAGENKVTEMCVQGFSHPTFFRPLDERDGWWSSVVPLALGINNVSAYTYLLQKCSPVQKTYEAAFELDKYFAKVQPLKFATVIDSLETKCFHIDANDNAEAWSESRLLPVAGALRHYGLPYSYLPSRKLQDNNFFEWPVVVLPGVSCLSNVAKENLKEYVQSGGLLVACGETGARDETGQIVQDDFMSEVFGLCNVENSNLSCEFKLAGDESALFDLPWPDEIVSKYMDGIYYPALALNRTIKVETEENVSVIGQFTGTDNSGYPAVMYRKSGRGVAVYMAGIPDRTFFRKDYKSTVLNFSSLVMSTLIRHFSGEKLPLRVNGFPPEVPIQELRPLDPRFINTFEFMPSVGEDLYIATVASYFRESADFQIEALLKPSRRCKEIIELVSGQRISYKESQRGRIIIDVKFDFDDCLKVFAISLEKG